jgi:hypothetical protein
MALMNPLILILIFFLAGPFAHGQQLPPPNDDPTLRQMMEQRIEAVDSALTARITETDRRLTERDADMARNFTERHDALAKLVDERIAGIDMATKTALIAANAELKRTDDAMEKRFASVNEFRQTLVDQAKTFLTKAEYGAAHDALSGKIDRCTARLDKLDALKEGAVENKQANQGNADNSRANIALALAVIFPLVSMAASLLVFVFARKPARAR